MNNSYFSFFRRLYRRGTLLLVAGCVASAIMPAQAETPSAAQQSASTAAVEPLAHAEGVTEYRLDNGLRVLLAPDASKPNVTVNMTYLVGSRHENYGQTGMAHLLEHMLFRGTPSLRDALGEFSRRGLQANGTTSADRTNYYASFAADPETLEWYIRWQADVMVNAMISREDLDAEMTVVRNEMESGENSPFRVLMQKMLATSYQWHNYGKTTIGARSDVENVDIDQLRAFYQLYYQPDNAVLIVTGQFDPDATLATIRQAFADVPRPERSLPPEYTQEPVQDGERLVSLARQGGSPLIGALYHIPAAGDPDWIALDLGISILGDTPSGRLYHDLVRTGLATSVFGFAAGLREPGYALFGAQLEPGMDPHKALDALRASLDGIGSQPLAQADLDRIRNKWLTGWSRTFADPEQLASALSESVAEGDWRLFFHQRDQVETIKLDDVQTALETWLVPANRTSGLYIPTEEPKRAPQATTPDPAAMLAKYQGRDQGTDTEPFDTHPENLDAATLRDSLELDNGRVELALLPKPTRGDRVEARLRMRFGDTDSLKGQRVAAAATAALLDRGTRTMSRQDIEDRFDALRAVVGFSGGADSVTAALSTTGEHLPELVEVVVHILREASFPEEELDEFRRQSQTAINNARVEPQALASRTLARHDNPWPADDVRYVPDFDEAIEELTVLTREDLIAFHDRFYGAGNLAFSAVGAFDPDAVQTALTHSLAGWKAAPAHTRIPQPYRAVPPASFDIATPDKANAFYLSTLPLEIQDTDPRFAALYLANYLLGSSETSRLWNRVRTREGLSYNVRSSLDLSSFEPSGSWSVYAIFAPENTSRLRQVIDEELLRTINEGFTAEEVSQGAKALLNYRKLARTRDSVLAGTWLHYLETQRSFAWSAHIDEELQSLTADQVNAVVRETLLPGLFSTAIAADPAKRQ